MSVFLDANILFSASNAGSSIHRLVIWLHDKERLVTSRYAAAEAARNISVKRAKWVKTHEAVMACIRIVPEAAMRADAGLPAKDAPILAAAIAAGCDYLVTGDKRDFGHLYGKTIEGVTVISVLDFANRMLAKHSS